MMRNIAVLAAALLAGTVSGAQAMSNVTLQDREQAACYNDVQTLCGDLVPDVDKVSACMLTKRGQVSAGCLKYFPPAQASN